MNRDAEDSHTLFNAFVAPSGMFTMNTGGLSLAFCSPPHQPTTEPRATQTHSIFNPMPTDTTWRIQDQASRNNEDRFLKEYQQIQKVKLFDRSQFDIYATTLFQDLVPSLLRFDHDLILFPLRGCRQPGILAKVIAGIPEERTAVFNYTYATREEQQARITSELSHRLAERIPEKAAVSIGIVDTAKGGYGSEHLAKTIVALHEGRTQQWAIQFHLLHSRDSKPVLAYQIPKHSNESLKFLSPLLYEVESLLVEDWSEGIGLSVEWNGRTHELKRCTTPGRVLLRDESSVQIIESESISELMTSLAVDAVNRQMLTDPQIQYVHDVLKQDCEVWES